MQQVFVGTASNLTRISCPTRRLSSQPTKQEFLSLIGVFVVTSSIGLSIIYFQCVRIRRKLREIQHRRQQKRLHDEFVSSSNSNGLRDVCSETRNRHQESCETLRAELRAMKELQSTVKEQVDGLQHLLARMNGATENGRGEGVSDSPHNRLPQGGDKRD